MQNYKSLPRRDSAANLDGVCKNMKQKHTAFVAVSFALVVGMVVTNLMSGCGPATAKKPTAEQKPEKEQPKQPEDETKTDVPSVPLTKVADKSKAVDESETQLAKAPEALPTMDPLAAVDKNANPQIKPGDWTQWAGSSYRNNVPIAKNIPSDWDTGNRDRKTNKWSDSVNIKWVANLGSQSYGNPVVADGRVYVGTNNGNGYLPRYPFQIDLGCLVCVSEKDGSFLWQHSNEKLPSGRVHDWEQQGICSTPLVEGKRLWFVSSRGHVVCLDTEGYYDGEDDGPVQNESARVFNVPSGIPDDGSETELGPALKSLGEGKLSDYARAEFERVGFKLPADLEIKAGEKPDNWSFSAKIGESERKFFARKEGPKVAFYKIVTPDDKLEADTIWTFDMMKTLGVSQHNMCSCSVTSLGDILFVNTSNGLDATHINLPAPDAPTFVAMDKNTGEVFWTDNSPGTNILHGQWSSPTVAELGGVPQVIFAAGDGWVYSFKADKGKDGKPELLWKFDANPKTSKWILGGRGTRNNIIATPVVYDGLVYCCVGQDPEHGEGVGHLWCISPNKRGDVSPELAVKLEGDKRVLIEHRRLQAVIEENGEVAVANPNSAVVWHYSQFDQNGNGKFEFEETMHRSMGTVAIKDDLLYISDFSGLLHCLDAKSGKPHFTYDMFAQAWGSPLIVDGKVYVGDEDGDVCIFKLDKDAKDPIAEINMGSSVYSTPVVANGVLYVASRSYLFAIQKDAGGEAE
jgi:outer membrane protein assembly factor BamB